MDTQPRIHSTWQDGTEDGEMLSPPLQTSAFRSQTLARIYHSFKPVHAVPWRERNRVGRVEEERRCAWLLFLKQIIKLREGGESHTASAGNSPSSVPIPRLCAFRGSLKGDPSCLGVCGAYRLSLLKAWSCLQFPDTPCSGWRECVSGVGLREVPDLLGAPDLGFGGVCAWHQSCSLPSRACLAFPLLDPSSCHPCAWERTSATPAPGAALAAANPS